jgi:hypothetical protein
LTSEVVVQECCMLSVTVGRIRDKLTAHSWCCMGL